MKKSLELPPVVEVAVAEQLWRAENPEALERLLRSRGLLRELRQQAQWSASEFRYADRGGYTPNPADLVVTASGTLNPFSRVGKCSYPTCRARAATDFAQSVALYSDVTLVPDPLTDIFFDRARVSGGKAVELHAALQTLRIILPLLRAGIVRLGSPFRFYCRHHFEEAMATLDSATDALVAATEGSIEARFYPNAPTPAIVVVNAALYPQTEHPIAALYTLGPEEVKSYVASCGDGPQSRRAKKSRKFLAEFVRDNLRRTTGEIFFDLTLSQSTHSLLLAGSRLEPIVLSSLERRPLPKSEFESWEALRTLQLPWLHELTAEEVLRLREEAGSALPRLRDLLRQRVASGGTPPNVDAVIGELREQVGLVEAELAALPVGMERRYRAGMTTLAMLFVIYGFGSGHPQLSAASMAALLATLAHLRGTEREHGSALEKLRREPGYVLLKGKQILNDRN